MLAATAAGAALHVVGVSQLSVVGLAPSLSLLALCLILLQLASEALLRASAVALFTAPLAAGLVGLALLLGLAPRAEVASGRGALLLLHRALRLFRVALLSLGLISA